MMKVKVLLVVSLLLLLATVAGTVLAAGESVNIDQFQTMVCTPGANTEGTVTHLNGTEATFIRFSLVNDTKSTSSSWTAGILVSGTYTFDVGVPANTETGDDMAMSIDLLDAGSTILVSKSFSYQCGIVPPESWDPHVFAYTADTALHDLLMTTPNADGVNACGVFALNSANGTGWGEKVVYVPRFPDCMPYVNNLTIACAVQGEGSDWVWYSGDILDLTTTEDGLKLNFTSMQGGHCGIFPG